MKPESQITTLHDLFDDTISRFVFAEVVLKNNLSGWIQQINTLKFKTALSMYLEYVNQHIHKLEELARTEKIQSLSLGNPIMEAYVKDTEEKISRCTDSEVKDACLLACIQSINHFKISTYGTATAFANALGLDLPAKVLHEAEINEKQIDEHLTYLAEHEINIRAKAPFLISA